MSTVLNLIDFKGIHYSAFGFCYLIGCFCCVRTVLRIIEDWFLFSTTGIITFPNCKRPVGIRQPHVFNPRVSRLRIPVCNVQDTEVDAAMNGGPTEACFPRFVEKASSLRLSSQTRQITRLQDQPGWLVLQT